MTVDQAIKKLEKQIIDAPDSWANRVVQIKAAGIVVAARHNVDLIMHRAAGKVKFSDNVDSENVPGVGVVIGIRDHSTVQISKTGKPKISGEQYLADKANHPKEGHESWLKGAVRGMFPQ